METGPRFKVYERPEKRGIDLATPGWVVRSLKIGIKHNCLKTDVWFFTAVMRLKMQME